MKGLFGLLVIFGLVATAFRAWSTERRARKVVLHAEPDPGVAIDTDATRLGLSRYRLRSVGLIVIGFAIVIGFGAAGVMPAAAIGFFSIVLGLVAVANSIRVWWFLRTRSWESWRCRFAIVPGITGTGSPSFVIEKDGEECLLVLVALRWRWGAFIPCDGQDVWIAGHPDRGGVVAPPGGFDIGWARQPLSTDWRERLIRGVLDRKSQTASPASSPDDPVSETQM